MVTTPIRLAALPAGAKLADMPPASENPAEAPADQETLPLLAICALHVDTPDPAVALAAVHRLAREDGLEFLRFDAQPYTKLGPHVRVTFVRRMPTTSRREEPVLATVSALCRTIGADAADGAHPHLYRHAEIAFGSPGFHAAWIMDARRTPFSRAEFLWVDIEVNTDAGAQADLCATILRPLLADAGKAGKSADGGPA